MWPGSSRTAASATCGPAHPGASAPSPYPAGSRPPPRAHDHAGDAHLANTGQKCLLEMVAICPGRHLFLWVWMRQWGHCKQEPVIRARGRKQTELWREDRRPRPAVDSPHVVPVTTRSFTVYKRAGSRGRRGRNTAGGGACIAINAMHPVRTGHIGEHAESTCAMHPCSIRVCYGSRNPFYRLKGIDTSISSNTPFTASS